MLRRQLAFGTITVLLVACTADKPEPTGFEVRAPLFVVGGNGGTADVNLGTHLTGDEEVCPACAGGPTPADSRAQGQAIFRVSADGSSVDFRLIASNIDNVFMAHIHCGAAGTNGPIRMWLYPPSPPPLPPFGPTGAPGPSGSGSQNGVLASGTFSPQTAVACMGMSLLEAMRAGLTYVNVHTDEDGVAPFNTGPGDFPGGEIRGQLGDKNN
jgi:hypothetical protein